MNEAQRRKDIEDHIDRDIQFACGTGVGLIAMRLFAIVLLFWRGDLGSLSSLAIAKVPLEIILIGVFTYGTYHRRMWGPIGQLALWSVTYFVGWYMGRGLVPPLGILGLIVWYGFYCGFRGVRDARVLRQSAQPAVTPTA